MEDPEYRTASEKEARDREELEDLLRFTPPSGPSLAF
jgi:hypothetical protein